MEIFAERLKYLRENLKLSQKEVAQRIHSTEMSISNYEKGIRTPSIDTLNELADCFIGLMNLVMFSGFSCNDILSEIEKKLTVFNDRINVEYNQNNLEE